MKGGVSITSYTTNTTSGSVPIETVAIERATVMVDDNERGFLITRRTIRTPIIIHVEDTKRVVPFSETIGFER